MKKILLGMLVIGTSALHAQATDPTYIFYQQHENLINPAAVGMEFGHTISVDIRNQRNDRSSTNANPFYYTSFE